MSTPSMTETSVFLTYTPYHILLSTSVTNKEDENILIIVNDFNGDIFIDAVKNSDIFEKVYVLENTLDKKRYRGISPIAKSIRARRIYWICEKNKIDVFYTSHDSRGESQYVFGKVRDSSIDCRYIEDGSHIYSDSTFKENEQLDRVFNLILFGNSFVELNTHCTHPQISQAYVSYPSEVREDIQVPLNRISKDNFTSLQGQEWIEEAILEYSRNSQFVNADAIVFAPHSESSTEREIQNVLDIVSELLSSGYKPAIKFHPRESSTQFISKLTMQDTYRFPTELPAELIYLSEHINQKLVVGSLTTALLSGKRYSDSLVISTARIQGIQNRLVETYENVGIQMPGSLDRFSQII